MKKFIAINCIEYFFMKASVLVVFLALLIASISIGGCAGLAKTTAPKIVPSSLGTMTSGGAGNFSHIYGTAMIREGATEHDETEDNQLNRRAGFGGDKFDVNTDEAEALPGPLLHQDGAEERAGSFGPFLDIMPRYTPGQAQPEVVSELAPSTIVYVGGTTIPLSTYQTNYGKYLWIESKGLRQYMSMPQYSSLPLMAYTSTGGPGEILEMFPSESNQGTYLKTYYNFNPGYNRIPYRGDISGRHYLLFSQNDESSNAIIIDVNYGMIGGSPVLGTMPSEGA